MRYPDPYDGMSDEEFHGWADRMLAKAERARMRSVTMRMPEALVERTKQAADAAGIPYQVLIRRFVESGLDQLERLGEGTEEQPSEVHDLFEALRASVDARRQQAKETGRLRPARPRREDKAG